MLHQNKWQFSCLQIWCKVTTQELEVLSLNYPYSLKTRSNDIMRFSVLGFRSDLRIELQAPVVTRIFYKVLAH